MGVKWFCDVTGKEVFMTPKMKIVLGEDGKPVMGKTKIQDGSGKIIQKEVPEVEYLEEKAFLVRLSVGDESIQRVLSDEALKPIKAKLLDVWNLLEAMGKQ